MALGQGQKIQKVSLFNEWSFKSECDGGLGNSRGRFLNEEFANSASNFERVKIKDRVTPTPSNSYIIN
jgi:hypothetical protein